MEDALTNMMKEDNKIRTVSRDLHSPFEAKGSERIRKDK